MELCFKQEQEGKIFQIYNSIELLEKEIELITELIIPKAKVEEKSNRINQLCNFALSEP